MTPDEFREKVLPKLISSWESQCLCANPKFQKLISFNFNDYSIGPTALADAEIVINALIRKRFSSKGESQTDPGESTQAYICPQCGQQCLEFYSEYSINMYQSRVVFVDQPALADSALYLVGFFGFKRDEFQKINDFQRTESIVEFLNQFYLD